MALERISVLVVDDHPIVRTGLRTLLEQNDDMQIVGEAESGPEALERAVALEPDVVLMDISMKGGSGLEAVHAIKASVPETKVLMLTVHDNEDYLREALAAGATGYVLKQAADAELAVAIRAVFQGGIFLYPSLVRVALGESPSKGGDGGSGPDVSSREALTSREEQVVQQVALGYTNREVANTLYLSVKTVETYRARAMRKLGLRTRSALVRYALERGLLKQ